MIELWKGYPRRKVFAYTAIIVGLYGALEKFVEEVLEAYLRLLCARTPTYTNLPEGVTRHHVRKSIELLEKIERPGYRGPAKVADVVRNLHMTLSKNETASLNALAYRAHTANVRCSVVDEMFSHAGIATVCRCAKTLRDKEAEPARSEGASLWPLIDDIAERRNEVSHGPPTEVLSLEVLEDYVLEVEEFGRRIMQVLESESLAPIAAHHSRPLSSPIGVYDNRVVCLATGGLPIALGDYLLVGTGDSSERFRLGTVQRIEIDHETCPETPEGVSVNAGFELDVRAKRSHEFYWIPASARIRLSLPAAS